MPTKTIKANAIYVNDFQAVYNASIQLVHRTSGNYFPVGDVDSDSASFFPLDKVAGLVPGQEFTVTLQAKQGGAKADTTVITYDQKSPYAATYAGSDSLKKPTFKYISIIPNNEIKPSELHILPGAKVSALFVNNYGGVGGGTIQAITPSGTVKTLGPIHSPSTGWYSLKGELAVGEEFFVKFGGLWGAAVDHSTLLTYDQGVSTAAGFVLTGWKKEPHIKYLGTKPYSDLQDTFAEAAIKVNSVHVNDVDAPYGATIQLVHTTSGDSFPLGPVQPDSKASFSLKDVAGLVAGQTFTITLQADEGGARADTTIITYDQGSPYAAAYSGSGSLKDPGFKYINRVQD